MNVDAVSPGLPGIVEPFTFFLTIWNGTGMWPAPPSVA